jgi:hypothetical protein
VNAERELFYAGLLLAEVEDTDLAVGDTAVEARLRVRLVFAVSVAASWAATHLKNFGGEENAR